MAMHPYDKDFPFRDFSPITPERLPAIIQAVPRLQADIESGDGPHVARDAVVRLMARLEGGEGLSASDPENAAISTALPPGTRRAVHFLFEKLKTDDQARWLHACNEFLRAVREKCPPGRRYAYSLKAWKYARALQENNSSLTAGEIRRAVREALPDERIPMSVKLFRDWLRRKKKGA